MSSFEEINLTGIKTYSAKERTSKVKTSAEATPPKAGMTIREFLAGLPSILKANDLKATAKL